MKTLIVVTPADYKRLTFCHERQARYLPSDVIAFVGNEEVGSLLAEEKKNSAEDSPLRKLEFINENELLPFDAVHSAMKKRMEPLLEGRELPRGITGWYYQQFLKMQYAYVSEDDRYMVWDGDTVPCGPFTMYADDGITPYLDVKKEYHEEYFETIRTLIPGADKVIGPSFISEHMLIKSDFMRSLISRIEANDAIEGEKFWEKIINSIPADKIQNSSFSEFETYGTFVALTRPTAYRLREWHSFRLAAEFFDPDTICERDYNWLAKDFHAISFEKNQYVREDHRNLFDNPEYQEKLSARQMLQIAQEEFKEGYLESWDILR